MESWKRERSELWGKDDHSESEKHAVIGFSTMLNMY